MARRRSAPKAPGIETKVFNFVKALLLERRWYWHFVVLLFLGELVLGLLIIKKIPYTKIDWTAYMQQVEGFLSGERDYSKLEGETGPMVYPALHLYIYTLLHQYLPAENRIRPAQYIFLGLYLINLLLVATIYYLAGIPVPSTTPFTTPIMSSAPTIPSINLGSPPRPGSSVTTLEERRHVPQILLIPLALSKREHSIYMLRLFNDPFAMFFLYASIVPFMLGGKKGWRIGCILFSLGLGVKMNILLFFPGLLMLLFQNRGLYGTMESVALMAIIQLILPADYFLSTKENAIAYFSSAFDFNREFLYEWTVNWRFLTPKDFVSRDWALMLLAAHAFMIIAFGWNRWTPLPGSSWAVLRRGLLKDFRRKPPLPWGQLPPNHIPLVLFTANLIGIITARSLHYQFHSWYFHQLPFLLYFGGAWGSPYVGVTLWLAIEWAWSVAQVTPLSSAVLFVSHIAILAGLWQCGPKPPPRRPMGKGIKGSA